MLLKNILLTISMLMLLFSGTFASGQCVKDGNNSEKNATPIAWDENISDWVCETDPIDYYVFTIPDGKEVSGAIIFSSNVTGTVIRIEHSETGDRPVDDVSTLDRQREFELDITGQLPPGTYYMRVWYWSKYSGSEHNYSLKMKLDVTDDDPPFILDLGPGIGIIDPLERIPLEGLELFLPDAKVNTPAAPIYVGSFIKLPVMIKAGSLLTMDDLEFFIPDGSAAGIVSMSRDKDYDPARPDIMLLAGHKPGTYPLQVIKKGTGNIISTSQFTIGAKWENPDIGPPMWITGDFKLPGVAGSTWGGGDPRVPENFNVSPAIGTNDVLIILIDTKDQRFVQNDVAGIKTKWEDAAVNGQVVNGQNVSTARYYREQSYGLFNLRAVVIGPVQMPGDYKDYFDDNGGYRGNLWQEVATQADDLVDFSIYEHFVVACQPVDASGATKKRSPWPKADNKVLSVADGTDGKVPLGTVAMPTDWSFIATSTTLAHELGHNLGLGDIYSWDGHPRQIRDRAPGGWALMANQGNYPHMLFVHKMKLGWIKQEWVKLYNFQANVGRVDDVITLHPLEIKDPPVGRFSGIEVRIAPGLDYYFEYRVAQPGQIGDQNLPRNDRVLGTDATFAEGFENLQRRKPVMLLQNDSDGDGPVLGVGQDYEEQDTDEQNFPVDFKVEPIAIGGGKADVKIQYGVTMQPDPMLRPWNPPVYQSPDIEVRNTRNKNKPEWYNVPWAGNQNTLVAKVKNAGRMAAPGVTVRFRVKDMTTDSSDNGWQNIGMDTKDVPAGATVEFETIWMPGQGGHLCIEARILHYQTPGPNSAMEATELNNFAQSNYDRFISKTGSPASREMTWVEVRNPYDEPAMVSLHVAQSNSPLYRTYIENSWLMLGPGESRKVRVMFEYAYGGEHIYISELERHIGKPYDVSIYATVHPPIGEIGQAPIATGGLSVQVVTGRATFFEEFTTTGDHTAFGTLRAMDTGDPVSGGKVIVTADNGEPDGKGMKDIIVNVDNFGFFSAFIGADWQTVKAYYLAPDGFADGESERLVKFGTILEFQPIEFDFDFGGFG